MNNEYRIINVQYRKQNACFCALVAVPIRQIRRNLKKQSQFAKNPNECNYLYYNGIWKYDLLETPKKQSQSKPISPAH